MSNGGASGIARPQQSLLPAQTGQQRGFGQPMMGRRTAGQIQPGMGRITGNDKQVNPSLFSDPNLGQSQGRDQGPIGTGVSASDVPTFNPRYNSGIAGGMQKYGGSYSDPNLATNGMDINDYRVNTSLFSDPNLGQPRLSKGQTPITGGYMAPQMG